MCEAFIKNITKDYDEYLKDESRKIGKADSISFPKSEEEIIDIMKLFWEKNINVTVQGARTGIAGGAVPKEGHILNLEKMNSITGLKLEEDNFILCVQPAVLLTDVRKAVFKKDFNTSEWSQQSLEALEKMKASTGFFFPPDPTEVTASIGGMVACNASGARSFHYGPTRNYIEGLRVILSDGSRIYIRRGEHRAQGYFFSLTTDTGRVIQGEIPKYQMPNVKNASGYYAKQNMDLIDLFIGCEGTLGIISEIEIKLLKKPAYTWGGIFFFNEEEHAVKYVKVLRDESFLLSPTSVKIKPAAIEYFNKDALELLRVQKEKSTAFSDIQNIKKEYNTAIYIEFDENSEEEVISSMLEAAGRAVYCCGSEEDTWVASTQQLMEYMKLFRHAVPEAVNLLVDQRRKKYPNITKLGTDMSVPDEKLEEIIDMYKTDLAEKGFESVMFGHIGNNHIHVNILPRDMEEYDKGKNLYTEWAHKVLEAGGSVSAEHGIGKLKCNFLKLMYKEEGMQEMMAVKKLFDPRNILNSGNLFL